MDLIDMLEERSKETAKKPVVFQIAELYFKASVDAKFTHFINRDKILATHEAMGIFYDKTGKLLDDFIETCAGLYPLNELNIQCSEIQNHIAYFKKLYDSVEKLRAGVSNKFIQSEIDMLQQETAHCLYRLKHLTT